MDPAGRSFRPFVARLLTVLAVATLALVVWQLSSLLLLLFGAMLISLALRAGADALARLTPLPAAWGVPVVLLLVLAVLTGTGWLVGDRIATQFVELARKLPAAAAAVEGWVDRQPWVEALLSLGTKGEAPAGLLASLGVFASSLLGALSGLVVILMVAVYLAVDPHVYHRGVLALFPLDMRGHADVVLSEITRTLRTWLVGQGIAMLIIGALTSVGLVLLGNPLALSLGMLAGLLEFVPFVGPLLAAVPAVLVAFSLQPIDALWTVLLYLAVQQVEGHLVMPLIQQRMVALPPVLTVTATVAMGVLFGPPGVLFATPLVVVVVVLVRRVYVEGLLE
jgi:predicted PurR-regulated permease PerM